MFVYTISDLFGLLWIAILLLFVGYYAILEAKDRVVRWWRSRK